MRRLTRRITYWTRTAYLLTRGRAKLSSILLYPIRRRLPHPRDQVDLRNGISLVAPKNEGLLTTFAETWVNRVYAPRDLTVNAGDTIVDIGAHLGVFTVWAATKNPQARVISVEPSPRMCDFLRRNVFANGIRNVSILQAACGGRQGEVILYSRAWKDTGWEGMNTLYTRDNYDSQFSPLLRTTLLTLEDIFQRFEIERCTFLKLDCEGAEYEILLSTSDETLHKVERMAMEYHVGLNEHTPDELVRFLEARGFEVEVKPLPGVYEGYLYARRRTDGRYPTAAGT